MKNEPVLYDPDKPLAHYEQAGKLYERVKKALAFGMIMPAAAFFCGAACVVFNPFAMAYFALFAIPFTLLSIIGCRARRAKLCLISVPLGAITAVVSAVSGSVAAPLGIAAYLLAAYAELKAIPAVTDFCKLKELPGFPLFDPGLDELSFAAMDRRGIEEFIDESKLYTEKTTRRFKPEELVPSDKMDEIVTGVSLKKDGSAVPAESGAPAESAAADTAEDIPGLRNEENADGDRPYEMMIKAEAEKNSELSDVELFG